MRGNKKMSIYKKRISIGNFLRKGEDFKDGDLLEVANEGKEIQGEFGVQNVFLMKFGEKEGNVSFNQTSVNGMVDAFGEDSLSWIGKQVKAWKIKQNVAGKFIDVWYFSHPDAELTKEGFVLLGKGVTSTADDDIPIIETDEGEGVNVNNIPF